MTTEHSPEEKVSFKDTLNLPKTDFPIRPNAKVDDPALLERWSQENLYEKAQNIHADQPKYILHDGPPYANGHLHLGHAYNKILKDILTKAYRMMGRHVPVIPGWDCHGLPIELKVTQEHPGLSSLELKRACRNYAQKWVDIQRDEFKRLGVIMDWDHPYLTMAPHYEASVIRGLSSLVEKKFIERKNKTVAWCPSCQTTLASAEIEYKERKDPSIYVRFPLEQKTVQKLFPEVGSREVSLLVWTTTPWTLPLNRAVLLNTHGVYQLLEIHGQLLVVGADVADRVTSLGGGESHLVKSFVARDLDGAYAHHPFIEQLTVPVILDESVGLSEGTACVHCAPGAGPLDYEIGVKNNLEIYSPVTARGAYSADIRPRELEGMIVADAQGWVIKKLMEQNKLWHKSSITHSYPHCWRCHHGLIFRATLQWFFNLEHDAIKESVLQYLNSIHFNPAAGKNFLHATVENRWEWCLSRQRAWGIPIPALLCSTCNYAYITPALLEKVADRIEKEGIEYWDTVPVSELVSTDTLCPHCHTANFKKETDILDVWFESGMSHLAVLYNNPAQSFPADMYLEGIDQHRGWFQSSLITSVAIEGQPSMKAITTHGFTVDAKGQKMSKSLGNVVAPQQIIDQLGTDGLRLWVASIGHEGDAVVSDILLRNVGEVYRKIRNTCRFLLQNLYDFNKEHDAVALDKLLAIDRAALAYLYELNRSVIRDYLSGNFTGVFHALTDYCTVELSSFYLDIVKDRLYVEKANGPLRRSAQTVLWYILDTLTRLMAPIMSFTAEQLSDHYQPNKQVSIHLQPFAHLHDIWHIQVHGILGEEPVGALDPAYFGHIIKTERIIEEISYISKHNRAWELLKDIRSAILKILEIQREQGLIKHSLEAQVTLFIDSELKGYEALEQFFNELSDTQQSVSAFLKEFFIVSRVIIATCADGLPPTSLQGLYARIDHAPGVKCPRCWQWDEASNPYDLCRRCQLVLS